LLANAYLSPPKGIMQGAITLPEESYVPQAFVPDGELMLASAGEVPQPLEVGD